MLQCVVVPVCCSLLQIHISSHVSYTSVRMFVSVAVCCSVLPCVAVCRVLPCVAVCCSVFQCVAVCCRYTLVHMLATHQSACSLVLQCDAV